MRSRITLVDVLMANHIYLQDYETISRRMRENSVIHLSCNCSVQELPCNAPKQGNVMHYLQVFSRGYTANRTAMKMMATILLR
jgi:hypothetical protein